jgi:hypothetical protein
VFRHHRDAVPCPTIVPSRGQGVRLLQSQEELQSAVERAQAFERRYDPRLRGGVYDQYLTVLADMMILQPKDIDGQTEVNPPASAMF